MGIANNPKIVTDGLVLCLDVANLKSYIAGEITVTTNGTSNTNINLTTTGANSDWAVWRFGSTLTPLSRKATGGVAINLISNLSYIGATSHTSYTISSGILNWSGSDSTPASPITNGGSGIYVTGVNNGFSFTVPAGIGVRTLRLYASTFSGAGRVRASLSDGSAPDISFSTNDTGISFSVRNTIIIRYKARSENQTLTVQWDLATDNGSGYVGIRAVWISTLTNVTAWNDLSGLGNNATLINEPSYNSNNLGSVVFDGTNDYASIPSFTTTAGQAVTYSGWLYSTDSLATQSYRNFVDSVSVNPMIWWNASGQIEFDSSSNYTTPAVYRDQWVYVALSKPAGSSAASYYVNGSLAGTGSAYTTTAVTPTWFNRGGSGTWKGNCSQFSAYNRALSAAEIQQNFNALRGRFNI
jgi:hypothetical protein